ncbi:hypothetical protein HHI36_006307 [Cryptolaemus montrouzieri]|uniref:Uncharacterized protein n=1 Tax=Cryptolaemus montrouzieri TaxID=559131 RepID=A0ABD2NWR8_9CUCU
MLVLYADTTAKTQNDTLMIQKRESVVCLERWFNVDRLSLNRTKTEETVFILRDIDRRADDGLDTDSVRLLDLRLNNTFTFEVYVGDVVKKLNKSSHELFQSHCNYGLLAWGQSPCAF